MAFNVWGPRQHVNGLSRILHPAAGFHLLFSEHSLVPGWYPVSLAGFCLWIMRLSDLDISGENSDHVSTTLGAAPRVALRRHGINSMYSSGRTKNRGQRSTLPHMGLAMEVAT